MLPSTGTHPLSTPAFATSSTTASAPRTAAVGDHRPCPARRASRHPPRPRHHHSRHPHQRCLRLRAAPRLDRSRTVGGGSERFPHAARGRCLLRRLPGCGSSDLLDCAVRRGAAPPRREPLGSRSVGIEPDSSNIRRCLEPDHRHCRRGRGRAPHLGSRPTAETRPHSIRRSGARLTQRPTPRRKERMPTTRWCDRHSQVAVAFSSAVEVSLDEGFDCVVSSVVTLLLRGRLHEVRGCGDEGPAYTSVEADLRCTDGIDDDAGRVR